MNFNKNHITMLSIMGGIALLIGLFALVALVQKQQEIRSRATSKEVYEAFEITDQKTGNTIQYKDEGGVGAYQTDSLDVNIKVKDLEKLLNSD